MILGMGHEGGNVPTHGEGNPLKNVKNSRSFSEQKLFKIGVPGCPQCIKINENGPPDLGNNLVDPLGAQDLQKYRFWWVIFLIFCGDVHLIFMGGTPPMRRRGDGYANHV